MRKICATSLSFFSTLDNFIFINLPPFLITYHCHNLPSFLSRSSPQKSCISSWTPRLLVLVIISTKRIKYWAPSSAWKTLRSYQSDFSLNVELMQATILFKSQFELSGASLISKICQVVYFASYEEWTVFQKLM